MKESGPIISLDKSEYREIPASEQTKGPEAKPYVMPEEKLTIKPEVKRPEIKPSRELNAEQISSTLRILAKAESLNYNDLWGLVRTAPTFLPI
jgi:hypothetical protein